MRQHDDSKGIKLITGSRVLERLILIGAMSKEIPASTIKRILIIEDTPNDIGYYRSLFHIGKEVHLLFLAREATFTKDKLAGLIDLIYEDIAPKIANYYVCAEDGLVEFLKTNLFDFYVADSLGGNAITLISEVGLSKDIVVLSSCF
jgi:hypothetical protein